MGLITPYSSFELTNATAIATAIVDGTGTQLTGFDASRPATSVITSVNSVAVSTTLLALNAARRQFYMTNTSNQDLYIAFAATATVAAYTIELAKNGGSFESVLNSYTGIITGIWTAAGNGKPVIITEVST